MKNMWCGRAKMTIAIGLAVALALGAPGSRPLWGADAAGQPSPAAGNETSKNAPSGTAWEKQPSSADDAYYTKLSEMLVKDHLAPHKFPEKTRLTPNRGTMVGQEGAAWLSEGFKPLPPPIIGREDALVLKTMNRQEMLKYILDGLEESLLEYEPAWVQHEPDKGYWALPAGTRHNEIDWYKFPLPVAAYGLLLAERDKPVYAGRYPRETVRKHLLDFERYSREHRVRLYQSVGSATTIQYLYDQARGEATRPRGPGGRARGKGISPEQRAATFADIRANKDHLMGTQRGSGGRPAWALWPWTAAPGQAKEHAGYVGWTYSRLCWYGRPQDRAMTWAAVDGDGRTLAELRSTSKPGFFPDGTTREHDHFSWVYIIGSFSNDLDFWVGAALNAKPEEMHAPYNELAFPQIAGGYTSYVRTLLRKNVSADGATIFPEGWADMYPAHNFSIAFAADATLNKNPESAAYLSRTVQQLIWAAFRRPFQHLQKIGNRRIRGDDIVAIYYMVKNWGLPDDLPDLAEVQARSGGVTWFRYQDHHYHHNPFKTLQIRAGQPSSNQTGFTESSLLVGNFSPTPWKQGQGMEFLMQCQGYKGPRDAHDIFPAIAAMMNPQLRSSVWGDYGDPRPGVTVDLKTRRVHRTDDLLRVALEHTGASAGIKRAFFSLGGQMTAILEEAPKEGKVVPLHFWVRNMDSVSHRAGHRPKVNWQIHLEESKTIAFGDHQDTQENKGITLAPAARWYNVDDRLAVALASPLPLQLDTHEWKDVRDTLSFGPSKSAEAVIFTGVEGQRMAALAGEVKLLDGLPAGWRGLKALAPEGYRILAMARFGGTDDHFVYDGKEPEGAPVFSVPTQLDGKAAKATFQLPAAPDAWSEEPHFYVTAVEGGSVQGIGQHHRLELKADGAAAKVTLRFFGGKADGNVKVIGDSSAQGAYPAEQLRDQGLVVDVPANRTVWLAVTDTGPLSDDRLGPYVDITQPVFTVRWTGGHDGEYWTPIAGKYVFKADVGDRSGVEKVEFYLNDGQLIGTDTEAPYECEYEITDTFSQFVYAVATDKMGNRQKSFEVPFGDGTVRPAPVKK